MEDLVAKILQLVQALGEALGDLPGVLFKVVWNPDWFKVPDWSYLNNSGPFQFIEILRKVFEMFSVGSLVVPRFVFGFDIPLVGHVEFVQDFAALEPAMAAFRVCQLIFFLYCFGERQLRNNPLGGKSVF